MPEGICVRWCSDCGDDVVGRSPVKDGLVVCKTCEADAEQIENTVIILIAYHLERGNSDCQRVSRILWRMIDGQLDCDKSTSYERGLGRIKWENGIRRVV